MVSEVTIAMGIAFWGFFASSPGDNLKFINFYQCLCTEKRQLHSRSFDMFFQSATTNSCLMQAWVTDDEIVSPVLFSLCVNDIPTLYLHVELVYHDDKTAKSFRGCNWPTPFSGPRNHSIKFPYLYHPLTSPEGLVCTLRYCDHRKTLYSREKNVCVIIFPNYS